MSAVEWDDAYDEEWAAEVANWLWSREGNVFRVEGNCPRCGHAMSREFEKASVVRRLTDEPQQEEDTTVEIAVWCNCTASHAGRPKGTTGGCGKSMMVELSLLDG